MSVLIEAISVIVKKKAIEERYPGGWEAFVDNVPNKTLCADEHIARLGFMSPADVEAFVKELEKTGMVYLQNDESRDIAVADQIRGFAAACSWAECGKVEIEGNSMSACRALEDNSGYFITPDGWKFEGSLSQTFTFAPSEQIDKSLKFLRHENGLDVYLNVTTGEEVYLGRTGES